MELVERLTRLNARHVVATSRLGGTEIELLGATVPSERRRLEAERRTLENSRDDIDRERDDLERRLRETDERLASLAETSENSGKSR